MSKRVACLSLALLCALPVSLVSGGAWAESAGGASDNGSKAGDATGIVLQEVVVSAPRIEESTLLQGSTLERPALVPMRAATSDAATLLKSIPGVSFYGAGGVSSLPVVHGLGDDRLRTQVDGMNLISACSNHMNPPLSYMDPNQVGSVKVFAGITPVSVGGDSIGGTIQVTSPAPEFARAGAGWLFKGQGGTFYRSNGNALGGHLAATIAGEKLSLNYHGATAQAQNHKAAKPFKSAGLAAMDRGWLAGDEVGSSSYKSANHALGLAVRQANHLVELKLGFQEIPDQGFPNQRMDMTMNESVHGNLHYEGKYRWGRLDARVYDEHTRHRMDFADDKQFYYGSAATVLSPGMPMNTDGKNLGAELKGEIILSERDLLRLGVEGQRYRLNDWWPPSPSVLPAGYTFGGMAPNTFWNINDGQRDRVGLFAEWEARWNPQWVSQLGVRSDTVMMDTGTVQGYNNLQAGMGVYGDPAIPTSVPGKFNAADRQRTDNTLDLTALLRYVPGTMLTFETGYARKSRSPNLYERYAWSPSSMIMEMINLAGDGNYYMGNLDLKPEVANTLSATADWHADSGERWGVKVTPYFTHIQDYIDVRRCPTGVCTNPNGTPAASGGAVGQALTATSGFVYLQYANQSAQLYGLDLSGHALLVDTPDLGKLTGNVALNYLVGENRTTGDHLYNIMPLNGKLALTQRKGKWTNTIEEQWVAPKEQVSRTRNEVKTGGYGLLNLRSSYEWEQVRLDLGVENVLDQFYHLPLGGAYVGQGATMSGGAVPWGTPVPGMGRSVFAGISVKF
ncbi:MAG: TonB-dependent receptor [Magnetococcales bacterium]|nr:TonB-dependent receptor [Magnetococcales bacterium]